jgi:hypothetical protein
MVVTVTGVVAVGFFLRRIRKKPHGQKVADRCYPRENYPCQQMRLTGPRYEWARWPMTQRW